MRLLRNNRGAAWLTALLVLWTFAVAPTVARAMVVADAPAAVRVQDVLVDAEALHKAACVCANCGGVAGKCCCLKRAVAEKGEVATPTEGKGNFCLAALCDTGMPDVTTPSVWFPAILPAAVLMPTGVADYALQTTLMTRRDQPRATELPRLEKPPRFLS
jgi:hypothetical protein